MSAIVLAVTALIDLIPKFVAAGVSVVGLWQQVDAIIAAHRKPSEAEWQELDAYVAQRKAEFEAAAAPQPDTGTGDGA